MSDQATVVAEEEEQQAQNQTTVESEEDDSDADFEAGFNNPTEETPPGKKPDADEVTSTDDKGEQPTTTEHKTEVKYRQITEDEYNRLMGLSAEITAIKTEHTKKLDTAFGKVGGIERRLAEISAATPTGASIEVTDEDVADLKKEFPELGELTLRALKNVASKFKGTGTAAQLDPQQVEVLVSNSVAKKQEELIEDEHPGWRDIVGKQGDTNAYRQWLAKQPAEYQQKLNSTGSAVVIARSIDRFKEAAAAEKEAADKEKAKKDAEAKAAADKAAKDAARKQRLVDAATPRGSGGHASTETEEDDFEAGFNSGPAGKKKKPG